MALLIGSLFDGIPEAVLTRITCASTIRSFAAGHILFHEQDPAPTLMVVVEGSVRIWRTSKRGAIVAVHLLGPGSLPGCGAVFRQSHHSTSATAVTAITMAMWPAETIRDLMADCPDFFINVLGAAATQTEEMIERLFEFSTQGAEQRLAGAILRLLDGNPLQSDGMPEILLSRQALSELAATTLYTVSRFISRWERIGLVKAGRERISICQPAALLEICNRL